MNKLKKDKNKHSNILTQIVALLLYLIHNIPRGYNANINPNI